jgi:tellurite resistance protein TerC
MVNSSAFESEAWFVFAIYFISLLVIEKFGFNQKDSLENDSYKSIFWFVGAIFFGGLLFIGYKFSLIQSSHHASLDFLTGYIIELSLSLDNLFIFFMLFKRFKLSAYKKHLLLNIGIWGAILMRMFLILFVMELVVRVKFIFLLFGLILIYAAIKMLLAKPDKQEKPAFYEKFFTKTDKNAFFIKVKGKIKPTMNLLALLLIMKTDLVFALDSIPAILTITQDFFIIMTCNIFALAGLRPLFFTLTSQAEKYYLLQKGIILIIFFIGIKLSLLPFGIHFPNWVSLTFIITTLTASMFLSRGQKA